MASLEIIVTHYNEPEDVVEPLLRSIELQQLIGFEDVIVSIVNDGDNILSDDFLDKFPKLKIIHSVVLPRSGVSYARNFGLRRAVGDYVMFCDCDDIFMSSIAFHIIHKEIEEGSFDVLCPAFLEDAKSPMGENVLIPHLKDKCFVHGKVYRREFLIDNGFSFPVGLTYHEDGVFNAIVMSSTSDIRYIDKAYYLWRWRDSSVCRAGDFVLDTYGSLEIARELICEGLVSRNKMQACLYAAMFMFDTYYRYSLWTAENQKEALHIAMECFSIFYSKYKNLIDLVSPSDLTKVSSACRESAVGEGMKIERITFVDWLNNVIKPLIRL